MGTTRNGIPFRQNFQEKKPYGGALRWFEKRRGGLIGHAAEGNSRPRVKGKNGKKS